MTPDSLVLVHSPIKVSDLCLFGDIGVNFKMKV